MNGIIRVFPRQTSNSPCDSMTFFDVPGWFVPDHKEVHICCVFTWDKPKAEYLAYQWETASKSVKLGGPAYDDPGKDFTPGMYVKQGITFTSRGCPNKCKFCFVPKREGELRKLDIKPGNIIQDNNFLACTKSHREKVYTMLSHQKQIVFRGGLETVRLTDWDIEEMRKLSIHELWIACDSKAHIKPAVKCIERLKKAGFRQDHIRCYVLIGDDYQENESRLMTVFEAGALPFAQLFQPEEPKQYSKKWRDLARQWSRPAITKAAMKEPDQTNEDETGLFTMAKEAPHD